MKSNWIDVTVPLHSSMIRWPGDPEIQIKRVSDKGRGDQYNISKITMGSHTGTHVDAPLHILKKGAGVDLMPFDTAIGPARVIGISDRESIKYSDINKSRIRSGERILFKTVNSSTVWSTDKFTKRFVYLTDDAASFLAERKVRLVGVDCLSVGSYKHGAAKNHTTLLNAGVWIVEGLNLSGVDPGRYDLICLPLRIQDGDASPVRALLRPRK
jgi:arylformamidase